MSNMSKIINIEDIENSSDKTLQLKFEEIIEGIKSKGPINADLKIASLGDFIRVSGNVSGNTLLECDLCLEEFEYELDFEIDELFAKDSLLDEEQESGQEIELKEGQFVTDLKGSDSIDITDLLYQSVILDFPNKKVCGINCKRGVFETDINLAQNEVDPRLAVFKNIRIKEKPTEK